MKKFRFRFDIILSIIFLLSINFTTVAEEKNYKIIKLVNDQVITNYDLEQRLKLFSVLNNADINKENIDQLGKQMLILMVDEKLQNEQIEFYEISINESEINDYINRAFLNEEKDINKLIASLKSNNININILKESIKITLGWNKLANRLYYRSSKINPLELENAMKQDASLSKQEAENMLLQKQILLRAKKLLRDIKAEANIENR